MGRIRKDALDLEFLPETSKVEFIGPKRISYFSIYFDKDYEQVSCPDDSAQKFLDATKLNIPINCLEGFNPDSDVFIIQEGWTYFMRWIRDNEEVIRGLVSENNSGEQIDFICTNWELKHIMLSLYDKYGWIAYAFRIKSEIFILLGSDEKTNHGEESEPRCNPFTNKLNYARLNVIRKITERVEERELNSDSETDIFSTISFSKIGKHRILHEGFTEFAMSKDDVGKPIDQVNFAALKLKQNLFNKHNRYLNIPFYRHLYWWASALVTGVETLICGDLDEGFTLRKLNVLPVSVLRKRTSEEQKKCLIALDKILDFIKSQVQDTNKVYKFHLDVETREVIVSPSSKSIEDFITP